MQIAGIFIPDTEECNHYLITAVKTLPVQEGLIIHKFLGYVYIYVKNIYYVCVYININIYIYINIYIKNQKYQEKYWGEAVSQLTAKVDKNS